MKPILEANAQHNSMVFVLPRRRALPNRSWNYQAAEGDYSDSHCENVLKPIFPSIGQDYLTREAHRHFASEAVSFLLLMLTTAPLLLNGASAIIQLIHSTGHRF
jgi:hypothetical protein